MKIYVVTKGHYSDYHIITATTNEEKAKKIAKNFNDDYDKTNIEIFEDSELYANPFWEISFDSDGDVMDMRRTNNEYCFDNINQAEPCDDGKTMYICVSAENAEHAIKIASEKRAEYLAMKAGIA